MKLSIRMILVKKIKFLYPEFELDTLDYPELEGKTLDEIRLYLEQKGTTLHPLHSGFNNLQEELDLGVKAVVMQEFPRESKFYVKTEEETTREKLLPPPEEEIVI